MEMLQLIEAFARHDIVWATYRSARTEEFAKTSRTYLLKNIGKSPIRLLLSLPLVFSVLLREKPRLIVSTGSEIAIPFFYLAKLLRIRTVFIESVCRVRTPSATGKVVYPVADLFLHLVRLFGSAVGNQFNTHHEAALPNVTHVFQLPELPQTAFEQFYFGL